MLHHGLSRANAQFPMRGTRAAVGQNLGRPAFGKVVRRLAESCGVLRRLAASRRSSRSAPCSVLVHYMDASSKAPTLAAFTYADTGIYMHAGKLRGEWKQRFFLSRFLERGPMIIPEASTLVAIDRVMAEYEVQQIFCAQRPCILWLCSRFLPLSIHLMGQDTDTTVQVRASWLN